MPEPKPARYPISRFLMYAAVAAVGVTADLWTKEWAFDTLGYQPTRTRWIWDGILSLETSLNEGALFGIGQGKGMIFAALSVLAIIAILGWLFFGGAARSSLLTLALGMVTGGILGNLYDRLGLPGMLWKHPPPWHAPGDPIFAVRDWIHFQTPWFDWPIFNIADSLLVCGAAMLVFHAWVIDGHDRKVGGTEPASAAVK